MTEPVSETTKEERAAWLSSDGDHLNARATRRLLRDYARLEQERGRLREALKQYVNQGEPRRGEVELWSLWQERVNTWKQARAALAPAQEPEAKT
jgi:hypothetical protein